MPQEYNIRGMTDKIKALRRDAEDLKEICDGIPTVEKNIERILANVKMLEINVVDRWQIS
jgi:predicted component of type VI protein secretion system